MNDDEDNDFDYDHITDIEKNLTDNYEHNKTYDYVVSYRLDRDIPPITTTELSETPRLHKQKHMAQPISQPCN